MERTPMADGLYGFNYFVRFGTAARPDHATVARLRYSAKSIFLAVSRSARI